MLCRLHERELAYKRIHPCSNCDRYIERQYGVCYLCKDLIPESSPDWQRGDRYAKDFYVYLLQLDDGSFYAGQTRDIERRIKEHENGDVVSTEGRSPILVWFNTVDTREAAASLELQLKHTRDQTLRTMVEAYGSAVKGNLPDFVTRVDLRSIRSAQQELERGLTKAMKELTKKVEVLHWIVTGGVVALGVLAIILRIA